MFLAWLKYSCLSILAFLAPLQALLALVFFLVFLDLITGVWASVKRKEVIQSAKLRRTVSKLFVYELALLFGFLLQSLLSGVIPVANLVAGVIGLAEARSFFENVSSISEIDFSSVLTKIGSKNDVKTKGVPNHE